MDVVWKLLRLNPSEFNPQKPDDLTTPVLPSGVHLIRCCYEFGTVYTVMKQAQKIRSSIGQVDSVITFKLAIYAKTKQVQWKCP